MRFLVQDIDHMALISRYFALKDAIEGLNPSTFRLDSGYKKMTGSKKRYVPLMIPNEGLFKITLKKKNEDGLEETDYEVFLTISPSMRDEVSQQVPDCRQVSLPTLMVRTDYLLEFADEKKDEFFSLIETIIANDKSSGDGKLMIKFNRQDYWNNLIELDGDDEVQSMDHIFLPEGKQQEILQTVDRFIANKAKYMKYGRAYKLSFLLEGKAGMGKSSIAKSIAARLGRKLYILNLACKDLSEGVLIGLISDIEKDSVLLIEDVDSFFEGRKRGETPISVSFPTLLNVLDGGFTTGNGLITFITANHAERMDRALVRPGRIDKIIHFGEMTREQFDAACRELIPDEPIDEELFRICSRNSLSMSALMDILFNGTDQEERRKLARTTATDREFRDSGASMYC